MLSENLIILRKVNGYSQEEVAERIHISRQAYGKWESGETIPDIMKCAQLADVYGVSVDSLLKDCSTETVKLAPAPVGKHIFGTVTMNDRGQIVIPKGAREVFALTAGSRFVVLGDEAEGLALVKAEQFEKRMQFVMEKVSKESSANPGL